MGTYNKISAGPTTYIRVLMPGIHLRRKERYIDEKEKKKGYITYYNLCRSNRDSD